MTHIGPQQGHGGSFGTLRGLPGPGRTGVFIPGQTSQALIDAFNGQGLQGQQSIFQQLLSLITFAGPPDPPEPSARRIVSPEGLELEQLQARRRGTRQLTSRFTGISIEDF